MDEKRQIRTDTAAYFGKGGCGNLEIAHFVGKTHKSCRIGAAATQSRLGRDAFFDDHLVVVEKVQQNGIFYMFVESDKGFVDGVGFSWHTVTPLNGKTIETAWNKGDGIVEVFNTHKAREQGVVAVLMSGDLQEDIDFGVCVDFHKAAAL